MRIKIFAKNIFSSPKAFFLENLGVRQTIFKNTFWLALAEGITKFLKLILVIYIARILGPTEYGKFSFALAFVSLFIIFSDFGLKPIVIRELSREKEREKEFSSVFSLKILLSLGTLILILVGSFFITPDSAIRGVIWILAVYVLIDGFSGIFYAFLRARQRMEYESWARILQGLIITGAGFFVLFNFPSVVNLSYSYLFVSIFVLISILVFFHFKVYRLRIDWDKSIWRRFLGMSWPLALSGIFGTIYRSTDSVMMGYWGQITQIGWYNAAYKIVTGALIPVSLISSSFFPALSVAFRESKERLQKIWNYFMETMIFLAIPIVAGGVALAPRIIDWIYDPTFAPSVFAFQILIVMAGIIFLYTAFSQVLIAANQQKKVFWTVFSGAIVNVGLNLLLIPRFSLYGAAFTTLVTQILILLLVFKLTIKFTSIKPLSLKFFSSFLCACLASIPMYWAIVQPQIYKLNVLLSVTIGAIIYILTFLILKIIIKRYRYSL